VRIRGLAAGSINDRRQLVLPHLMVKSYREIAILDPPTDPERLPFVSIDEQLRFTPNGASGRRIKVRGVVISACAGEPLYLREGERGLLVRAGPAEPMQPGDVVEVLGFPEMGSFRAYLADATIHRVGQEPAPVPRPVTVKDLMTGTREADLVALEGDLAASYAGTEGRVLALQAGEAVVRVRCPSGPAPQWPQGSRLSVSGICRVGDTTDRGYRLQPVSFDLWARSPEDIRLLRVPSWWTPHRLTTAVGALAAAIVAVLIWVYLLRRRIREQTAIIRSQLAREIVLDERQRIAREVHDTLEQGLVGLALRLDAAASVADSRLLTMLEATRHLVDRIHTELRNLIWDLREPGDGGPSDLAEALARSTRELPLSPTTTLQLDVTGTPWPLPGPVEHNLLRIAQETITNALKHANPQTIKIELSYAPTGVALRVEDDGRGFEAEETAAKPGHFGLVGIRERARKLGVPLELTSGPGRGTTILVRVPRVPQPREGTDHHGGGTASASRTGDGNGTTTAGPDLDPGRR
jgi:signal transduction histidine kinase